MANRIDAQVAIVGAGIVGVAVAYYLSTRHGVRDVAIIDPLDPMSLTSSKSGENYRNWWPHPAMRALTDHSTDLMEAIAAETGDRIAMTRRGYALVTRRRQPDDLIAELHRGYGAEGGERIRIHETASKSYRPAESGDWRAAPDGVDVLCDPELIRAAFPSYAPDIATVLHIRRAGSISGQQLGQFMLDAVRERGGRVLRARLVGVEAGAPFRLRLEASGARSELGAAQIVNAAGPHLARVGAMLGESLPVSCVYQQKIAFEDRLGAIPRTMPFSIDLDGQTLAWSEEERDVLASDPTTARLVAPMRGGIHCRPDGPQQGKWIKLGWAYNDTPSDPDGAEPIDPHFPDILLRAASRLNPGLSAYVGQLPRGAVHYGGYYTMTRENWPLVGPLGARGAFVAGALSGYGTMAAAAVGDLTARWMVGAALPPFAANFAPSRYADAKLMAALAAETSRGVL
ncbi:MAG: FAD-binding oxidoreductase [Methylobacteriaceae bacterium]|nr:FAD-binding oxidoreductase [Methylobacteriaceae bacterium]